MKIICGQMRLGMVVFMGQLLLQRFYILHLNTFVEIVELRQSVVGCILLICWCQTRSITVINEIIYLLSSTDC